MNTGGMQQTQEKPVTEGRLAELLADAGEFFEDYLWESDRAGAAREVLAATASMRR